MTNTQMLRERIDASGLKLRYIASYLGITYQGFLKKMNNATEFKASEIRGLHDLLHLSRDDRDAIFFAPDVEEKSTTIIQ